jgi:hypothetical protein
MATDPSLYGICDGCGMVYLLTGDSHCAECGMHEWCCRHGKITCTCDIADDEARAKVWVWSDCQRPGHEEDCALVHCTVCDLYSSDCDEPWRKTA